MPKWKATMPRQKAGEGKSDAVLAYRNSHGHRIELQCKLSDEDADALMQQAIAMMNKAQEPK